MVNRESRSSDDNIIDATPTSGYETAEGGATRSTASTGASPSGPSALPTSAADQMTGASGSAGTGYRAGQARGGESGTSTGQLADQAQAKAGEVVGQAQETMGQVAGQVREQATRRMGDQVNQAADRLGSVSQAFQTVGQQLREQDQGWLASYTDRATEQVDRFSNYLREKDVDELVGDVEELARRQPALFLGGAFALGLLAARFLKSSRPAPESQGYRGGRAGSGRGTGYSDTGYRSGYAPTTGSGSRAGSETPTYQGPPGFEGAPAEQEATGYEAPLGRQTTTGFGESAGSPGTELHEGLGVDETRDRGSRL